VVTAATTRWSIAPNGFAPESSASITMRSPTAMNGVTGLPVSMISIIRRSARQDTPRSRAAFDTVPLPRMVPAMNRRVFAMCWMRSQNENCISGPASQSPITCLVVDRADRAVERPSRQAPPASIRALRCGELLEVHQVLR
jgi:hypothetical protein